VIFGHNAELLTRRMLNGGRGCPGDSLDGSRVPEIADRRSCEQGYDYEDYCYLTLHVWDNVSKVYSSTRENGPGILVELGNSGPSLCNVHRENVD